MSSRSITLAKKKVLEEFRLRCEQAMESFRVFLEGAKVEFATQLQQQIDMAAQLPGIDLTQYSNTAKIESYIPKKPDRHTESVTIEGHHVVHVTVIGGVEYEGFVLLKVKPEKK